MAGAPREPERATDLVLIGFGAALLLTASRLRELWARDEAPWWAPFLAWGIVLALAGWVARAWIRHDE